VTKPGWLQRRPLPDHLKVPWRIADALVVFLGAWIALPVILVLILRVTSPVVSIAHLFLRGLLDNNIVATFTLTIIDAAAGLVMLAYFLHRYHAGWQTVGWRKFDPWKAAGYLMTIFLAFIALAYAALVLVSLLDPSFNANQPQSNDLLDGAQANRHLALIGLVVLPPIIEETVFRGFIFPAIASRWGYWAGALSSSVLFGLAHLQANVGVYTFVLGLLLCFMYARLRSIFPGMALHMLNNYLAFLSLTGH
jgi:membrane protease YdiL (CAAX protease family)